MTSFRCASPGERQNKAEGEDGFNADVRHPRTRMHAHSDWHGQQMTNDGFDPPALRLIPRRLPEKWQFGRGLGGGLELMEAALVNLEK